MTILQALDGYYERLAARDAVPLFGYSREKISYALVLSPEGEVADLHCLLETSGKKQQPKLLTVPQAVKRTSSIKSNFLWDKTSYVLGVSRRAGERVAQEHADFKVIHETALADAEDEGLVALRKFIAKWTPERFEVPRFSPDMLDTNLVFRLDGEERSYIHERPAARDLVAFRETTTASKSGFCLVTGGTAPITRLHTLIKGVQGAKTSGASLVSFNHEAFESFGKSQGNNAPVSERAAFGYGTALNALLERGNRNRLRIGDATTVFWAEVDGVGEDAARAAEDAFAMLADPPTDEQEARKVADAIENIAAGRPIEECVPEVCPKTRFYVLGLAPNAARLSVRFWHRDDIGRLAKRIGQHWLDLKIEPRPWKTPPAVWLLLRETALQRKTENIPPLLSGALMRAILTGNCYPQSLLAMIVMRMRADHEVNGLRAALCKACLARDFRLAHEASPDFKKEDVPVALNCDEPNPAYRLGRLFAVLEGTQRAGLGKVNATIRDRYFGAASSAPGTAFPMLIRNANNHLKAIRGKPGKQGLANWHEKEIGSILDGLVDTAFPRSLSLDDQGRFAIGYYQQREAIHRRKSDNTPAVLQDADLDNCEEEV